MLSWIIRYYDVSNYYKEEYFYGSLDELEDYIAELEYDGCTEIEYFPD